MEILPRRATKEQQESSQQADINYCDINYISDLNIHRVSNGTKTKIKLAYGTFQPYKVATGFKLLSVFLQMF